MNEALKWWSNLTKVEQAWWTGRYPITRERILKLYNNLEYK